MEKARNMMLNFMLLKSVPGKKNSIYGLILNLQKNI